VVTSNNRVYGLRLQYRVGAAEEFQDLVDEGGKPVECGTKGPAIR
jgi:hypothetical protein